MNSLAELIHALAEIGPHAWTGMVALAALSVVALSLWLHRRR
jgi:hypothetical protein